MKRYDLVNKCLQPLINGGKTSGINGVFFEFDVIEID